VAYLALVGALSQFCLVAGQLALVRGLSGAGEDGRPLGTELGLWNLGTVLVPVGVFTDAPAVVALGSVVLLAALALFAARTDMTRVGRTQEERAWLYAYRTLVAVLTGSVLVGAGLGQAFPWQWS
jgi:hypothetical protein